MPSFNSHSLSLGQLHFEFHKESCLESPGIKISSSSTKSWGEPVRTILFRFTSFLPSNFQGGHFRGKTPARGSFASQKYRLAHCAFKMAATRRKVVSLGHAIYLFACHQEFSVYACLDMADFIRERESRRDPSPARENFGISAPSKFLVINCGTRTRPAK
ncbi:hypothetical protein CDAR_198191 [Caerostris darwini]|uniref:Uncharacterized protein n=1 Tax=Caerostris darwini TaxID=1538125 RepID=A0AAV4RQJ1_9ARAC|nr:hypothetical protein CDAR_198191 [Caerostris darwini]